MQNHPTPKDDHTNWSWFDTVSPDGKAIQLNITTANGQSFLVDFPHAAFAKFIQDLIAIGANASIKRTGGVSIPFAERQPVTLFPTLITGLGIGESADRTQMGLLLRLGDMDLSFQVRRAALQQLAEGFVQMTKALDADELNPL